MSKRIPNKVQADDVDDRSEEESETDEEHFEPQKQQQGSIQIFNTGIKSGGAVKVGKNIETTISVPAVSKLARECRESAGGSANIVMKNKGVDAKEEVEAGGSIITRVEGEAGSSRSAKDKKPTAAAKRKPNSYDLKGQGSVLIINNMFEKDSLTAPENPPFVLDEREGSDEDVKATKKLFEDMGCNVLVAKNVTSTDLRQKLDAFKAKCKDSSFCLTIVMTHGDITKLYMEDWKGIDIHEDLVYQFSEKNFKSFSGRPKIFLIQACAMDQQTPADGSVTEDGRRGPRRRSSPPPSGEVADVFMGLACLPHRKAYRNDVSGSWYIQSIQEVFKKSWEQDDLETMHTAVAKSVFEKVDAENKNQVKEEKKLQLQTPHIKKIGFKKPFYFPKIQPKA